MLNLVLSALATAVVGAAGGAGLANVNLRDRLAAIELKMAEKYVNKEDLNTLISRMESHLVRIEGKFDELLKKDT